MARRFLLVAFLLFAATLARVSPAAALPQNPARFIQDLGNKAIAALSHNLSSNVREARFERLYVQYFDAPRIARFVLGRYWWVASHDQRRQFEELFEKYVVFAYSARLSVYSGETLRVTGSRPDDKDFLVSSEILYRGGQPPTKILWRLRREGDGLKIVDVMVEGISMAVTQRQEFASVITRNGGSIGALLAVMRRKIEEAQG